MTNDQMDARIRKLFAPMDAQLAVTARIIETSRALVEAEDQRIRNAQEKS